MLNALWNDDLGVILSAELILIGTILVLGLVVGLVEVEAAIIGELNDMSSAFGNVSQSYQYAGFASSFAPGQFKARTFGSAYNDDPDLCDAGGSITIVCNDPGEVLK